MAGTLTSSDAPATPEGSLVHEALRHAVDEVARLLVADGAILYLTQPDGQTMRWAYDAGISSAEERGWMRSLVLPIGTGMYGRAVAEGSVRITDDYMADHSFQHAWMLDEVTRAAHIASMAVAPLAVGDEIIGALGVYSARNAAFDEAAVALLKALAEHAGGSVANAQLIERLAASERAIAHQAESERTLRDIAARIASITDQKDVLQRVVDESRRLLGADGAHLCLMADSGAYLTPVVVAGGTDADTTAWLHSQRFPLGAGMNGLAAETGRAVKTADYQNEPRIPHEPDDQESAARMGLGSMAVAPLRTEHGRVLGTLAISYGEPREITGQALELLQGLADHAAIAVTNARLLAELRHSEERYRYLLTNSPDIAFSIDEQGVFTFMSDAVERITGWRVDEVIGQHFSMLTSAESQESLRESFKLISTPPYLAQAFEFWIPHRDGHSIPVDMRSMPIVLNGEFKGAHGRVRDLREQVRLQTDLQRQAAELAAGEERAHLARELHDSVTQALFSMTLTTRSIELLLDRDLDAARARLVELRELERDALAEMRGLIFELRPANIEVDGLVQAVRTHAAAVEGRTGIPIAVECGLEDRLPLELESGLYRITQEAIHNVVKHASASKVRVSITRDAADVRLTVEDDGVGFDPAAASPGTLGLAGMRSRAERLGGTLTITSELGKGAKVAVAVPTGT
jgi:PAS domain S-box-containing protein